jgi:hypothetical protein
VFLPVRLRQNGALVVIDTLLQGTNAATAATAASALLWSLAYVLIIRTGSRDGVPAIPFFAMLLNLAWEFVFSFVYPSPAPQIYANYPWFLLDLVIAWQWFSFGRQPDRPDRAVFTRRFLVTFLFCLGVMVFAVEALGDTQGRNVAYSQNLLMSWLFVRMLRVQGPAGQSLGIAVSKMLGTVAASAGTLLRGLDTPYLRFLFVAILVVDLDYVFLLRRAQGKEHRNLSASTQEPMAQPVA